MLKLFYKLVWTVRHGPLGGGIAGLWHKFAPHVHIWKKIYGVYVCLDLRDSLIWAVDPGDFKELEGFDKMLEGVKGNVWDVGCSVGIFSLYAASQGNKVVSFDISPKAIQLLEKSAQRNRFEITPICRAFGVESFEYTAPQDADPRNRPGAVVGQATTSSITFGEAEEKFGKPDFIKMDIEHAETDFLKSEKFREWIKANRIPFLLEIHDKAYWDLVWPEVPHCTFDSSHVFFYPSPEIVATAKSRMEKV
ncbi:MAG TPA: FkbM family methyltransferase [Verrucomicrobiae bacterium]|jgi:FkbM family methyltransferase|nr:FkbM family methyltransferase [Verrucomicrobiae bacterium]